MKSIKRDVARALLSIHAVRFTPDQPITFKSGIISPVYVDNRILSYHPPQWQVVMTGFQNLIQRENIEFDVVAGIAVGGVPHSSTLAYLLEKSSVFVRKKAKEHGSHNRVEGGSVNDKRVLLIEDMVTTGGSSLDGAEALRQAGAKLDTMLSITSYGFAEAKSALSEAKITLHTLTDFDTLLEEAYKLGRFTQAQMGILQDWFADPHKWAERQDLR